MSSARKLPRSLLVPRDLCLSELTISFIPRVIVWPQEGAHSVLFPRYLPPWCRFSSCEQLVTGVHEFLCLALTQRLDRDNTQSESEPADEVCGVLRH